VVAYDDSARVVQELRRVDEAGRDRLRRVPDRLRAGGSTNLDAGMRTARRMAERHSAGGEGDGGERMTRVVYITDAMPNQGQLDARTLRSRLSGMADGGIHSTFVGVGVDFNSRLVNALGAVEGANYYTVDSAERFDRRMSDGFRYMTTPIAFDLSVSVESDAWRVARVYGAPGSATDGELLHVNTLFPSRRQDGGNEGGVILAALDPRGDPRPGPVRLTASYRTPDGERHEVTRTVRVGDRAAPFYGSTGARKAVALSRYADLVRNWAAYERRRARGDSPERPTDGVESRTYDRGRWEQTSVSLRVSDAYRERFAAFEPYFHAEVTALGADRMRKELRIVRQLAGNTSAVGTSTAGRVRPAIGSAATGVTGT
jgi:Ca-activated chloride channel family protein